MIAILICDRDAQEQDIIAQNCRRQVAIRSEESAQIEKLSDSDALSVAVGNEKLIDLLYYDFNADRSLGKLREFRNRYKESMLMLIADISVSPLEYLRPGIAPDSLMLRPLNHSLLDTVNGEFIESFLERFQQKDAKEYFVLNTREEKVLIPYSQIYYFEARDKKLYVCTRNEEFAFYDTIESLSNFLPEHFQRCHRSYIVNTQKILRVLPAENYIELRNQLGVPVSRSYKALLVRRFA